MIQVSLTELGQAAAVELSNVADDDLEHYPEGIYAPDQEGYWTVADDILVMLAGPMRVLAVGREYRHQQRAVLEAMAAFHPRANIAEGFRQLCKAGYVDCVYNLENVLDEALPVYSALGHALRLQLLRVMVDRPLTVAELAEVLDRPPPTIYHHLTVLRDAGLVYQLGHGQGFVTDGEFLAKAILATAEFFSLGGDDDKNVGIEHNE